MDAEKVGTILAWVILTAILIIIVAVFGGGCWLYMRWYNNNHYTAAHINSFMSSCEAAGDGYSTCNCIVNTLQNDVPYSEFKADYKQYLATGSWPANITGDVYGCVENGS